jgi:inosine-uridine nucleoside N-ribohydrolase
MKRKHLEHYSTIHDPMAQHIARIVPHYRDFFESTYEVDGIFVHDSSAIAYVIDPSLFKTEQWPIRVETEGLSRGKTWPNLGDRLRPEWENRPRVNVCVEVDSQRMIDLEMARMEA